MSTRASRGAGGRPNVEAPSAPAWRRPICHAKATPTRPECYSASHAFRDALAELGARHILIPPYTPRWNGKIERFFGTLDTEWAHGRVWPNSTSRDRALASFIRFYNRRRPNSAAGGRPRITRVHQVREQDT
jgi:hypothetical protein